MYNRLMTLFDEMENRLSRETYNDVVDSIEECEHDILRLACDGLPYFVSGNITDERFKEMVLKASEGMKTINDYCETYGYEKIFDFDDSDANSIYKCASAFDDSVMESCIKELEEEEDKWCYLIMGERNEI